MKDSEKTTLENAPQKDIDQNKIKTKKNKKILVVMLISFFFLATVASGVFIAIKLNKNNKPETNSNEDEQEENQIEIIPEENEQEVNTASSFSDYKFADYKLETIDITPSVTNYVVNSDLSNVYFLREPSSNGYYEDSINQELSQNQKDVLAKDWFIVVPTKNKEFFTIYESNRYNYVPSFITTDSVLHTYHLLFDTTLKNLEEEYLYNQSTSLAKSMTTHFLDVFENSQNEKLKTAAKRNLAYFSVAAKLFDPNFIVSDIVKTEVEKELAYIEAHSVIEMSPVMAIGFENPNPVDNLKEDYTQYIPRGHYTKSDELKRYFNGQMWLGRITFLAKDETTTLSALLITETLKDSTELLTNWENIFAPITFFVGKADDLTYYDYVSVYEEVLGGKNLVQADDNDFSSLLEKIKTLTPPEINSIPVYDAEIQPDREKAIKGFRFMGQRFAIDAMIFQKLIYRDIKETEAKERKYLPTALEIPTVLGSDIAWEIVKQEHDFLKYPNYESQVKTLTDTIADFDEEKWTQNLYWSWLYTLKSNVGDTPENYPSFMQSEKWEKKELNTFVSSWTELKHDTILYGKQAYAEMGSAGPDEVPDDKGYVEPNIELWNRLLALIRMTKDGLVERNILTEIEVEPTSHIYCSYKSNKNERMYCNLVHMEDAVKRLLDISKKELTETALTEDEYQYIKFFGGELEDLFMSSLEPDAARYTAVDDNPAMVVADVATNPNGQVLEEGTGYINSIYVIVPVEGELRIAKGAVYSQYEFIQPIDDRLTDEAWREMLENGDTPELSDWQKSLITEK